MEFTYPHPPTRGGMGVRMLTTAQTRTNPTPVALLIIGLLINVGCSHRTITPDTAMHVLPIDRDGTEVRKFIEGTSPSSFIPIASKNFTQAIKVESEFSEYVTRYIQTGLEAENAKEILIFVHGGLTELDSSLEAAPDLIEKIEQPAPGELTYYPILINWESGMLNAYWDHWFRIRNGRVNLWLGGVSSPLVLAADLGRAIGRLPYTLTLQGIRFGQDKFWPYPNKNDPIYDDAREKYVATGTGLALELGCDKSGKASTALNGFYRFFGIPAKIVTTSPADAVGRAGWDNMKRRTRVLFRSPKEFKSPRDDDSRMAGSDYTPGSGGVSVLFRDVLIPYLDRNRDVRLTLVGHSMGAFVVEELIREYGPELSGRVRSIVYMAAASPIRGFLESIVPFLQENTGAAGDGPYGTGGRTEFFNLTLHPISEINESHGIVSWKFLKWLPALGRDSLPRGTLLHWIDMFAEDPATDLDRTMGTWSNVMRSLHTIPADVRDQVTLKGFSHGKEGDPQMHGDFNDLEFNWWRSDFWTVSRSDP